MTKATKHNKALIIAGEASGDFYGGHLVENLIKILPDYNFMAYGGSCLENAGANLVYPLVDNAVIGVYEAIRHLPQYLKIFSNLKKLLRSERPSPVILIDYGGFNMKVAAFAKSIGLKVIYYIPPKVWIWNKKRAKTLAKTCDLIVTIFPFEPPLYTKHSGNAVYCGHPLIDSLNPVREKTLSKTVALLPGSRPQEITTMLPVFLDAAHLLLKKMTDISFEIPIAHTVKKEKLEKIISTRDLLPLTLLKKPVTKILKRSVAALSTSGTVTLETAITGIPQVITYKVSPFSALIFNTFVKAPFIGLPNIIAKKEICPEITQKNCTPENIAKQLLPLLTDTSERQKQKQNLAKMYQLLGEKGATGRIAKVMLPYFNK